MLDVLMSTLPARPLVQLATCGHRFIHDYMVNHRHIRDISAFLNALTACIGNMYYTYNIQGTINWYRVTKVTKCYMFLDILPSATLNDLVDGKFYPPGFDIPKVGNMKCKINGGRTSYARHLVPFFPALQFVYQDITKQNITLANYGLLNISRIVVPGGVKTIKPVCNEQESLSIMNSLAIIARKYGDDLGPCSHS